MVKLEEVTDEHFDETRADEEDWDTDSGISLLFLVCHNPS